MVASRWSAWSLAVHVHGRISSVLPVVHLRHPQLLQLLWGAVKQSLSDSSMSRNLDNVYGGGIYRVSLRLHPSVLYGSLPQVLICHAVLQSHHLKFHLAIHYRGALEHSLVLLLAHPCLVLCAGSAETV